MNPKLIFIDTEDGVLLKHEVLTIESYLSSFFGVTFSSDKMLQKFIIHFWTLIVESFEGSGYNTLIFWHSKTIDRAIHAYGTECVIIGNTPNCDEPLQSFEQFCQNNELKSIVNETEDSRIENHSLYSEWLADELNHAISIISKKA